MDIRSSAMDFMESFGPLIDAYLCLYAFKSTKISSGILYLSRISAHWYRLKPYNLRVGDILAR